VEKAKEEIEAHIAARTGTQQVNIDDDFKNNGTEVDGPVSQNLKQPPVSGGLLNARYAIVFFYNFKVGLHQQFISTTFVQWVLSVSVHSLQPCGQQQFTIASTELHSNVCQCNWGSKRVPPCFAVQPSNDNCR